MKPAKSKAKVLFIFPSYNTKEETHYPYWYELFDEVAKSLKVVVLFESGQGDPTFKNVIKARIQKVQAKPFNLIDRMRWVIKYAKEGYRKVYIHYSYGSVVIARLVSLFYPLKIYYWNCEKYEEGPTDRWLSGILKIVDVLVTGSETIADSYREVFNLGEKDIRIVPNWVGRKVGRERKFSKGKKHILFVHRLSARKGSRELPIIIERVSKEVEDVHFHIVGSGPDRKILELKIKSLKLGKNVSFYGSLPLNETVGFYKGADCFMMPSRAEGFPRVILEAMIYKLPFVATKVGNVEEIVGERQRKYLVSRMKPEMFAKKVVELINEGDVSKLVEENYNRVGYYNKSLAYKEMIKALVFEDEN